MKIQKKIYENFSNSIDPSDNFKDYWPLSDDDCSSQILEVIIKQKIE